MEARWPHGQSARLPIEWSGRGHCVVFLSKAIYSQNGYRRKCWGEPGDGLASHPGGSRNTPSRFMLRKPEISAGLVGLLGS